MAVASMGVLGRVGLGRDEICLMASVDENGICGMAVVVKGK